MRNSLVCFGKMAKREVLLFRRQPGFLINAILFFIMLTVFFPLTMPADNIILRQIAPGLAWIATLLAMLLASERLFQQDYEDGLIEQWVISGHSLTLIAAAKLLVHWLLILIPLLLFCPVFALMFGFSLWELLILTGSLIAGTPTIICLCALAAAFSIGMQQKGVFMALVLLPLTVPVMIFGSGSLMASMQGLPVSAWFAMLTALSVLAVGFLPFVIAIIMRINLVD